MRLLVATGLLFLAAFAPAGQAQERRPDVPPPREELPRAATREVARLYEGPHALRAYERTEIPAGRTVEGNVSVIDGPLILGGRVNGRVLAINADVVLQPGARIDGDLLVVGGDVEGERAADVTGEIRVHRQAMRFTREGDRLIVEEAPRSQEGESWWRRWERRRSPDSRSRFIVASAGPYNRVEGLPINIGPSLRLSRGATRVRADAFATFRTGSSFRSDSNDVGYDLGLEASRVGDAGVRVGGRLFSRNAAVESWQLSPLEYGLSAFLFRRDYLDLFGRQGGKAYVSLFDESLGDVTLTYTHERWSPRASAEPWTLLRRDDAWRPNPTLDEARMHVLTAAARFDTRNDDERPWAGWFVQGDVERGTGEISAPGVAPTGVRTAPAGPLAYTRGFVDARRYNRVGPSAQLNFRVVAGGWLGGDPLPLQRRLSVSGAGAVPGFDFRTPIGSGGDAGTCSIGEPVPGRPALCDRTVLGQVEYRGDLHFDLFGGMDWGSEDMHFRNDAVWVVFADAGRGWLVGDAGDGMHFGESRLPPLSSFRTDMGAGLDFGQFGIFAVKAISDGDEPLNFLIRLRHRF